MIHRAARAVPAAALIVLAGLTLAGGFARLAQADQASDKLKAVLQDRLGTDAQIKGIAKTPVPGLYEVNLGTQVIYSNASGDYVLLGDLVDTRTRANLTQARLAELNKVDFASLPLGDAVKVVKGNGKRKIAVFSDPNCPYCRKLEQSLKSIDNVTVYTFLYPVLTPDSTVKSKAVWCSADRGKAWEAWMIERKSPGGAGNCDTTAIDKNLALGQKLGVTGTPTIILADGRRLPGALPTEQLEKEISAVR